jgi:hypothetical protein
MYLCNNRSITQDHFAARSIQNLHYAKVELWGGWQRTISATNQLRTDYQLALG